MTILSTAEEHQKQMETEEFGQFIDFAIDAGLEMKTMPESFQKLVMKWTYWAESARVPNPAQIDDGSSFVYDSDEVYARHHGRPLTFGIVREAEMAEYNQAVRLRSETRRQKIIGASSGCGDRDGGGIVA